MKTFEKLGPLVKYMQSLPEDSFFSIPADIFANSSRIKNRNASRRELALFDIHYQKQGVETKFKIYDSVNTAFWDEDNCRTIRRDVYSIVVENEKTIDFFNKRVAARTNENL